MKRMIALALATLLVMSLLSGCGDNTTADDSTTTAAPEQTEATGELGAPDYNVYDELSKVKQLSVHPIYLNIPAIRTEDWGYSFVISDSLDYAIVVTTDTDAHPGESIDDIFPTLFNGDQKGVLMQFYRADYADFEPENTTHLTLVSGNEALRFEGVQTADDYGTAVSFDVFGYAFMFNDYPVIVSVLSKDTDDAKVDELIRYVDEMVQTVRTEQ